MFNILPSANAEYIYIYEMCTYNQSSYYSRMRSASKMTVSTLFPLQIGPRCLKLNLQAAPFASTSARPSSPSRPPPMHRAHARYSEQWRRHRRARRGHHQMQYTKQRSAPAGAESDTYTPVVIVTSPLPHQLAHQGRIRLAACASCSRLAPNIWFGATPRSVARAQSTAS
jgi:hypothetical protein